MEKRRVIYYSDELNDEFSAAQIAARKIDENFDYCPGSLFKRFTAFFWYRIIATPVAFLFLKIAFRHKTVGRDRLKPFRKEGIFLFGNHTHALCDTCVPSMLVFPQRAHVICHAANVSIPHIGLAAVSMGAIPLPDGSAAFRNFRAAIARRIGENRAIAVYPEAHIWPYYTGIRPFTDVSFGYPVALGAPVFCFTNTYQKRRFSKRPRIVTYVDGPFFPPDGANPREKRAYLREKCFSAMSGRAKNSDCVVIEYIKRD